MLRLMFAMAPWEKSMAYSDDGETEAEAQRKDEVLKSFFARTAALLKKFDPIHTRRPMRWLVRHLDFSLAHDTHIHICAGEQSSFVKGPCGQGTLWKEHKSQLVGRKLQAAFGFWPSCCEGPRRMSTRSLPLRPCKSPWADPAGRGAEPVV